MSSVLIIEDDTEVQSRLSEYLCEARHEVICATNGSEGLALATLNRLDAVVVDVRLPDVDGVDLAQRLRDLPSLETVPILFLTGNVDSHVVQAAHWMSHTALLRKPCHRTAFIGKVNQSIDENRQVRSDSHQPSGPVAVESRSTHVEATPARPTASDDDDRLPEPLPQSSVPGVQCENSLHEYWQEFPRPTHACCESMAFQPVELADLVDDVSHDARSALFVLTEFASQAADGLDATAHAERLRTLSVIEDRLVELTMLFDILHAGRRVHAQAAHEHLEHVSLREFVSRIAGDCEHLCHRKSCRLSQFVGADPEQVVGLRIQQVRTAVLALFAHLLSIAESGSSIQLGVSIGAGTTDGPELFRVTIGATTVADRSEFTAAVIASDRSSDPCRIECSPKLGVAASIAEVLGGQIALEWARRQFVAVLSLPVCTSANPSQNPG